MAHVWAEVLINLLYVMFLKWNQSRKSGSKNHIILVLQCFRVKA